VSVSPFPLGSMVSIRAEIVDIEDQLVQFVAQVSDEIEVIGEAEHTRAIIDVERFLKRVTQKAQATGRG
jgi:fluoroacetyl-CoA thioesterase